MSLYLKIMATIPLLLLGTGGSKAALDPAIPVIAGPTGFNAILIDESTVELSWNNELLDGSSVDHFQIWDGQTPLAQTVEPGWQVSGIDRNSTYDFSVSAVTSTGEATRRSNRIFYDLPQLDPTLPDEFNAYLPPLENLRAELISPDAVQISWDLPGEHWSWVDPAEYQYSISINGTQTTVVGETSYTVTGLVETTFAGQAQAWFSITTSAQGLSSRQADRVLVDPASPIGAVFTGYPGFNSFYGLRTAIYSATAAEAFWQAHQFPNIAHVYLNGRLVDRSAEIYSRFFEGLPPGQRTLVSIGQGWPFDSGQQDEWFLGYDYPLMHAWIETPPGIPNPSVNVEPVSGLRTDVYSSSAAEIFWDRPDTALARYRLYLEGEFLTETDAVSWFLDSLPAGTEHHFTISVVGADGHESEQREIRFTTLVDPGGPATQLECQVSGLRASVYSSSAAEVFWDRSVSGTHYEIWLDDVFVTNTDAISWFANGFEPASLHRFVVRNADDNCNGIESFVEFELAADEYIGNVVIPDAFETVTASHNDTYSFNPQHLDVYPLLDNPVYGFGTTGIISNPNGQFIGLQHRRGATQSETEKLYSHSSMSRPG